MSRHRLVRNLVEDDYYDDYDDYDDDYYDEEEYGSTQQQYAPPTKTAQVPAPTQTRSLPVVAAKAAAPLAATKATKQQPPPGVTKPPPGWGQPSGKKAVSISIRGGGGVGDGGGKISKPPPGWGKPETVSIGGGGGSGGVSKPPSGWGKPNEARETSANTTTTTNKKTPSSQGSSGTKQQQQQQGKKPLPDSLKQNKSQLSMVVVGHVDAGKSTMMGQLLVQVGQVTKRAATKQGQLAWLLDEEESERERGVTMQIATKTFSTPNHGFVMLDAPGHADFIPIMITGAAHADVAILVIAATRGEFEAGFERGGQTKEHVILARGLGVSQVIVAINKLDVDGLDWDQGRYEEIQYKVREYLLQQQFAPKRIRFVPVSGLTGENIKEVSATNAKLKSWYNGPTLLKAIDGFQPANRHVDKPLRFMLTDVYAEGRGVIARGRVVQGYLRVDERLIVCPVGDSATVSKLEHLQPPTFPESSTMVQQQERLSVALAGDTVEVVLTGIDIMRISVGNLLANPGAPPPLAKKARAKILVMDDLSIPIIRGAQVLFHMQSLDVPAVLNKLIALTKRDGSIKKERPRALTGGASATVEFTLSDKICMEPFSACRALGRFVLRRSGDTIAVGIIEELIQE